MAYTWFRFYNGVPHDPKVQRLPLLLFRFWVNLLCLASANDGWLPSFEDLQYTLRLTPGQLSDFIGKLVSAGLLDQSEQGIKPHNWDKRQFKSDGSTERVKRFRKRSNTVSETLPETGPYPDTDTDQKETSLRDVMPKPKRKVRTQLPDGFPFQADLEWSNELWLKHGRVDLCHLSGDEAAKFRDHHSGKLTMSADWPASWRTWARNAIKFNNGGHNGRRNGAEIADIAEGAILAARRFNEKQGISD